MSDPGPAFTSDQLAGTVPPDTPDTPDTHMPMVDRVAALEDTLTALMARHNAFVNTVVRELGL